MFDASVETSVKDFQQSNGLTVDGIVRPATWAKLPAYREASPTLRNGSTGPGVAWLQQVMKGSAVAILRHIEGVLASIFPLSQIVEDEIVRCFEDVEEWLDASHKHNS
jgi:peptidoglycan hydrolase-like protein with peptidoglycan-binding domain